MKLVCGKQLRIRGWADSAPHLTSFLRRTIPSLGTCLVAAAFRCSCCSGEDAVSAPDLGRGPEAERSRGSSELAFSGWASARSPATGSEGLVSALPRGGFRRPPVLASLSPGVVCSLLGEKGLSVHSLPAVRWKGQTTCGIAKRSPASTHLK